MGNNVCAEVLVVVGSDGLLIPSDRPSIAVATMLIVLSYLSIDALGIQCVLLVLRTFYAEFSLSFGSLLLIHPSADELVPIQAAIKG